MEIIKINIKDLKEYENNPVIHSREQINKLAEIIKRYGFRQPIVIDRNNVIVAGHGRLQAVKKLGYKEVDCVIADDLTDDQIRAYRLADNKIKELSLWDEDLLKTELLNLEDINLELLGFNDEDLKFIEDTELKEIKEEKLKVDDEYIPEEVKNLVIKRGDLIELGNHRILCGDSFNKDNLDKLLKGIKVDAVVSDPPYGMNLDTDFSTMSAGKNYRKILNDDKHFDCSIFLSYFKNVEEQFWWGANYYIKEIEGGSWLVWDKRTDFESESMNIAKADYTLSEFELCWSKVKHRQRIARFFWFGFNGTQFEPEKGREGIVGTSQSIKRIHANQKPVRLYNWLYENFLKIDYKNIWDGFLGSGSSLIAAEISGKNMYGLEYEEEYCQMIIERYLNFTGEDEIIINGQKIIWSEYRERVPNE